MSDFNLERRTYAESIALLAAKVATAERERDEAREAARKLHELLRHYGMTMVAAAEIGYPWLAAPPPGTPEQGGG